MPAHEVFNTLIDIWSGGCNPVLHYSLPILFSFELSSFILSALGIHRRCHYAIIRAEAEKRASDDRLEAALAFEKKKRGEEKAKLARAEMMEEKMHEQGGIGSSEDIEAEAAREDADDRAEIASMISDDQERLRTLRTLNFGPSFGFGFSGGNQDGQDGGKLTPRKTVA
jgi:hypothetical protein